MVLLKILGTILVGAIVVVVALFCLFAIASSLIWIWEKLKKFSTWCVIGKIFKWIGIIIFSIITAFWLGIYLFGIGAGALESLFGIVIVL